MLSELCTADYITWPAYFTNMVSSASIRLAVRIASFANVIFDCTVASPSTSPKAWRFRKSYSGILIGLRPDGPLTRSSRSLSWHRRLSSRTNRRFRRAAFFSRQVTSLRSVLIISLRCGSASRAARAFLASAAGCPPRALPFIQEPGFALSARQSRRPDPDLPITGHPPTPWNPCALDSSGSGQRSGSPGSGHRDPGGSLSPRSPSG